MCFFPWVPCVDCLLGVGDWLPDLSTLPLLAPLSASLLIPTSPPFLFPPPLPPSPPLPLTPPSPPPEALSGLPPLLLLRLWEPPEDNRLLRDISLYVQSFLKIIISEIKKTGSSREVHQEHKYRIEIYFGAAHYAQLWWWWTQCDSAHCRSYLYEISIKFIASSILSDGGRIVYFCRV